MGEFWLARTPTELRERVFHFVEWAETNAVFPVAWKAEKYQGPRSLDQNDRINAMYRDIAEHTGEGVVAIRRHCKLHFGVPILRAHDAEFRGVYDRIIKPHDYPDKLEIMDYLPVTSRMKKPQASEYIDTVQREYPNVRFQ